VRREREQGDEVAWASTNSRKRKSNDTDRKTDGGSLLN